MSANNSLFSSSLKRILPLLTMAILAGLLLPLSRAGEPITPAESPASGKAILVVKDSKDAQTIDADGQDVAINGNRNKVNIKGKCHSLTIGGELNFVSVDSVSSITLTGSGNEVAWMKAEMGEKPEVTDKGKGNVVSHSTAQAQ